MTTTETTAVRFSLVYADRAVETHYSYCKRDALRFAVSQNREGGRQIVKIIQHSA